MARADLSSTANRAPGARPAPTLSTIDEAHTGLIERLVVLKPHRILYIADARDLEERAKHLQQVFGAVLDYVGAIVTDTDHVPGRVTGDKGLPHRYRPSRALWGSAGGFERGGRQVSPVNVRG
jgi:hypothetical protein